MVYVSISIPISSRGVPRNSLLYLVQAKDPKIIVVSLLFSLTHRDNISSVSLASNPIFHVRTRHIEANYHYIHDQVVRKEINVRYVSTKKRVANIYQRSHISSLSQTLMDIYQRSHVTVRKRPINLAGCINYLSNAESSQSSSQSITR